MCNCTVTVNSNRCFIKHWAWQICVSEYISDCCTGIIAYYYTCRSIVAYKCSWCNIWVFNSTVVFDCKTGCILSCNLTARFNCNLFDCTVVNACYHRCIFNSVFTDCRNRKSQVLNSTVVYSKQSWIILTVYALLWCNLQIGNCKSVTIKTTCKWCIFWTDRIHLNVIRIILHWNIILQYIMLC